jgi:hypothetical protein
MGCAIPFEAQYSFALPTALTPPECAVSDLAVHDAWDGLVAVFRADCGFGQQAYLRPLTYAGEPKAAPILVSKACADGIKQVGALSSAVGPKGVVVISACVMTSTSAALTSTLVKPDSSLTAAEPIETLTYYNNAADALAAQMPVLVWNPSATTFGLARRGAFRRLSDTGKLLAGVVKMSESTTSSTPIRSSAVINGNWHFLRGGAYSGDSALCSTVSPLGVSLCNDKSSDPLRPIFLGGDRLLSVRYRNELRFAPFSPDTCSTAEAATIGYVRESDINELYNAVSLSSAYHAVLYSGETGLQLAIFTLRPVALVSVIAVSSAGADAQLHLQKDRLAVTFHRDGRAYLLVSEQTLHSGQ